MVRGLSAILPGRKVLAVDGVAPGNGIGLTINSVRRYGKFIVIDFEAGMLFVHLGMTGQLLLSSDTSKFTRARIFLDEGVLRYDDIRKFGRIYWSTEYPKRGPDPLQLTGEEFIAMARTRKTRIKSLLLDQAFISGMGNIYTDEALFAAGIHPCSSAARLSRARLQTLHTAMNDILSAAIAAGGSSISDYVNARGESGSFQTQHQVYSRHGKPCPRCGTTLMRMLVSQRGTTLCPKCQKR